MKWAMTGLAAMAVVHAGAAHAGLQDTDLWIGFSHSNDGFLLDQETGEVWMTGPCLKALSRATRSGSRWVSHTVELVSVGRAMATLDQRFELDINDAAPHITVISNGRGGAQSFPASLDRACQTGGHCAQLIATQTVCQG